ncbi:MAG: hypothetical protein C4519_02500 [Desulfobacteraceae bacterium]|nr:MAG: hypothetical protein C4519_02500 [Desulfobacteraceae bacterium]
MEADSNVKATTVFTQSLKVQQALRIQRFGMALSLYFAVIVAVLLADLLGLEKMGGLQWAWMIGLAVLGNGFFFLTFITGRNLRFSDPALTWMQIAFSGVWGAVPIYALTQMRPSILMFYIPAFSFGMLRLNRREYLALVAFLMGVYGVVLLLHYTKAPAAFETKFEIFAYVTFGIVLTWFAFFGGFISNLRKRLQERNAAIRKANQEINIEIEERKLAQIEKDKLIIELQQALSKVKTLSGLLPICASCKKIRDDQGYWNQLESYIARRSEAEFSHSICPDCARKIYPEFSGSHPSGGDPTE